LKSRLHILIPVAVGLLVVVAIAAYAYDSSRDERVAQGITVAGVDIGGMSRSQARARLERVLVPRYNRTLVVRAAGSSYKLSAREASVGVDVDGMVDAAVARSRRGNLISRTWRDVTGGEVDEDMAARVTYSRAVAQRFVARVAKATDVKPVNASVSFSGAGPSEITGKDGRKLDGRSLAASLQRALLDTSVPAGITATVRTVHPKVRSSDLADEYPYLITVDRGHFELHFFRDLKLVRSYRIAVGQVGLETPAGLYHIQNKAVNPAWHVPNSAWAGDLAGTVVPGGTPQNPIKARWMGIFDGAGIHGTDNIGSLGSAASHGCVRMSIPDVIDLYDRVPVQTPIYIA
jgi:lipoprotein-anchoring transpeptidase ErfK/SrfK